MYSESKILFLAFFDMCRLTKRPQDLPASTNLLTICIIVYTVLSILLTSIFQPVEKALITGVIAIILIMIFTLALLQATGKSARWTQTVTALFGTSVIINIISIPVLFLIDPTGVNTVEPNSGQSMALLMLAVLECWNIVIRAHILRHALEVNFAIALFIAIIYIWIIFSFTSAILPMETM